MNFPEWWSQLTKPEQRAIGENNALFVWQECQKHTLMTIEEACKAQVAYDQGFKDGRKRYEVQVGGWRMHPSLQPGMIWIESANGEGGDYSLEELASVIGKFCGERF